MGSELNRVGVEDAFADLSARQIEVMELLASGLTNKEIAARLKVSPNTIRAHIVNVYAKAKPRNRFLLGLSWLVYRGVLQRGSTVTDAAGDLACCATIKSMDDRRFRLRGDLAAGAEKDDVRTEA